MRSRNKPEERLPEGDDGRTIVNMNVEGMPWYTPDHTGKAGEDESGETYVPMTREESRMFTWGALKAALLVTGVMCLGLVLFVLFCVYVWFQ